MKFTCLCGGTIYKRMGTAGVDHKVLIEFGKKLFLNLEELSSCCNYFCLDDFYLKFLFQI